jgi:DNA modification methylase
MTDTWFDNGVVQLYQADARSLPIPDNSVDCVVTSPPYWGLRDYGLEEQGIGLEPTPEAYCANMVEVFREVWRVLKPTGTVWMNLGDSYSGGGSGQNFMESASRNVSVGTTKKQGGFGHIKTLRNPSSIGLKPKDLVGIPWRVAFALQADGWYLRSDIIWSKPNPMPESVSDRPTKAHEYVFLLTKRPRYYYDADAIREASTEMPSGNVSRKANHQGNRANFGVSIPYEPYGTGRNKRTVWEIDTKYPDATYGGGGTSFRGHSGHYKADGTLIDNPLGRNKRTVWEIATQPYPEAHFATYPEKLVEPCILAGTSEKGVCAICGKPWERMVETSGGTIGQGWHDHTNDLARGMRDNSNGKSTDGSYKREYKGWQPTCDCVADTVPATVLDPFAGSATTLVVAQRLGRRAIGTDLSAEYLDLASKRIGRVSLPMF